MTPERLFPVMTWIRFVTGQSTLGGGEILGGQVLEDSMLGEVVDLFPQASRSLAILPHVDLTTICHGVLKAHSERRATISVPVYADILLDAIQSDFSGDYMKAVLYSAIAVECVAATRVEEEFHRIREVAPEKLRLSKASPASSNDDPVYASLRGRARRDFRTLMHELPAYVLERSLMSEEPSLYRELVALREVRNKFVHGGIAPSLVEAYRLAKSAFGTALRTFAWFKAEGRFVTKHGQKYGAG